VRRSASGCCEYAEHVVVVDETGKVEETWYGDVKVGDTIAGFPFGMKLRHPVGENWGNLDVGRRTGDPKEVTGKKLVLFLVRDVNAEKTKGWKGVWEFEFNVSTAWVEDGKLYALHQLKNPGELVMIREADNIAEFKKSALEGLAGWKKFREVLSLKPSAEKAAKLRPYLARGSDHVKWEEAMTALQSCGEHGVTALRGVLLDPNRSNDHQFAIRHLVEMGEPGRAEVFQLMEIERDYWKSVAAELPQNWLKDNKNIDRWMRVRAFVHKPEAYNGITLAQKAVVSDFHEVLLSVEKTAGLDWNMRERPSDKAREILKRTGQ
jgi:hypothetical protein